MRTSVDSPEYPVIGIQKGERSQAKVRVIYEDRTESFAEAPVDFAPGAVHVHFSEGRIRSVFEFHSFRRPSWILPFASWFAASLGRSVPLQSRHLRIEMNALIIEPPWPLDFHIRIEGMEQGRLVRIAESFGYLGQ